MDSIKITGIKRITINDNPQRVIEFNPSDILFAERFYEIYREFEQKQVEFQQRSKKLDQNKTELDENGLPANFEPGLKFLKEVCTYMREKIDILFGTGTSQTVFGDALSFEMIAQFFEGITPFVYEARSEKVKKYTAKGTSNVMK